MYAWIWRHLPFGLAGKITGSVLLAAAAFALLWFLAFPWMDAHAWFNDVQVTDNGGGNTSQVQVPPTPAASNPSDYQLPYSTTHNNTAPGAGPASASPTTAG